jgi:hypothetical protein
MIQDFSYYFCMTIEGSGSGSRAGSGSGSIPLALTSGSESERTKNTWIRWIRIRTRNTGLLNDIISCKQFCGSKMFILNSSSRIQQE